MNWTREQKLAALLRLPWTIRVERDEDEGYLIARVAEIPSALATADTDADLERELWESLQVSLEVYLDHGDNVPLPPSAKALPWERPPQAQRPAAPKPTYYRGEVWEKFNAFDADVTALAGQVREVPAV